MSKPENWFMRVANSKGFQRNGPRSQYKYCAHVPSPPFFATLTMSWSVPGFTPFLPLFLVVAYPILRLTVARRKRPGLPLPPGPAPLPLLGNVFDIDVNEPWKSYTDFAATYGDLVHVQILDEHFIIVNSQADAIQLFEKSSQIYSDRPFLASAVPFGLDCNFGLAPYGDYWRLCRRIFHQTFRAEAAVNLRPLQLRKARDLIVNMIDDPAGYHSHYSTFAGAISMSAVYGYEPRPLDDPMVQIAERYNEASLPGTAPFKSVILKLFPFVLHLPDWFPGSSMKRQSAWARKCATELVEIPYKYALDRMENGVQVKSMVSDHVTRMQGYDESYRTRYEFALKSTAATALPASLETTSSTLMVFTLAMVLHPHVSKRAQAEIDAAIGTNRLPEFHDRANLPYVEAILRETMRWQPLAPIGAPHATTRSDIYKGYYIPKGAIVFGNTWAMSRDESRYPNASQFNPDRFFDADGALNDDDPARYIFGFGRRICAGRYVADASLWSAIVTMLATLDFSLAKDAEGNDIEFEPTFLNSLVRRPVDFPCSISLRPHIQKTELDVMLGRMEST